LIDMKKHYFLIGIGGIGMSGIARLLLACGVKVSGSDIKETRVTGELKALGADIYLGHRQENIGDANLVIYSSAIKEDNPEIIRARKLNLPLIKRAEALAQLMQEKSVITVTGSHGKTTTTSLISYMLIRAGLNPTVAVGGILKNIDTNACMGNGAFFVAEADESDGSFLYYRPKYSCITNIDREHLDYYKDFDSEVAAFRKFLERTQEGGVVFGCGDDANVRKILADYKDRYLLFGLKHGSDIYPDNIKIEGLSSEFDCFLRNKFIARFRLALAGEHNISNALAVVGVGLELGIDLEAIKAALAEYRGAGRRLEVKFKNNGLLLIDDYAHHPTEIKATLNAARRLGRGRMIAVFQPHRFTRTHLLMDDFSRSFGLADYVVITDIYAASEPAIKGVHARALADKIKAFDPAKEVVYLAKEEISGHILNILKNEDLVITLGAGDIVKVSDELAERLKSQG